MNFTSGIIESIESESVYLTLWPNTCPKVITACTWAYNHMTPLSLVNSTMWGDLCIMPADKQLRHD